MTKCATVVATFAAMMLIGNLQKANADVVEYVQNGSFETLSGPGQLVDWNPTPYWSVNMGFAEDRSNSLSTNCSGPSYCVADITQTLSDTAGQTLTGSLWYLPGQYGPPNDLSVFINGVTVLDVSDVSSSAWLQEAFSFTASGSDQLDINVWNYPATSFIDNVSVTGSETVAPEPSAATYAAIGVAAMMLVMFPKRVLRQRIKSVL